MLLKPFTAYVAGVATIAFAHSAASGAPGKLGFALGVFSTLLLLVLGLASRQRALWAGNFLLRVAGPSQRVMKVESEKTAQVKIRKDDNPVFAEVVLALRGLGTDQKTARWAAGQATMRLPAGDFNETFRLASQIATGRAA